MEFLFIILMIFILNYIFKKSPSLTINENTLRRYFSNLEKISISSTMTLYKGDKSAENFLIAVKSLSTPISDDDMLRIYDTAEKFHLHNKILFTNENTKNNTNLIKKLKAYDIQVLNYSDIQKLINNIIIPSNLKTSSNSKTTSILKTSDTSDDKCEIEEPNNPIQYKDSGFFSFLRNKPDRL